MTKLKLLGLALLGLTPTIFFVLKFILNSFSNDPSDWETFAVFFSGTTGTLFSILAGFLLYDSLKSQKKQNAETVFFNYLETFSKEKEATSKALIEFYDEIMREVHKNERVDPGTVEEKQKKAIYVEYIRKQFIADYSIKTKTPRLKEGLNKFFRGINVFCHIINDSSLDPVDCERLRSVFLSLFHDKEIIMICYYYCLLFDIINSNDGEFTSNNFVKSSGLFKDPLNFADDFPHNFDPRKGHFDEAMKDVRDLYRKKRTPV